MAIIFMNWICNKKLLSRVSRSALLILFAWVLTFICFVLGPEKIWAQALDVDTGVHSVGTQASKPVSASVLQPVVTPSENPYLVTPSQTALPQAGRKEGSENTLSDRKPFQLKATQTYQLPPEMYGQWAVTATLLETDMTGSFPPVVHDIWQFEQAGNVVSLSNPNTGAYATIHVDRVQNNWATFHHRVVIKAHRKYLLEQPSIRVSGDRMLGKTTHTYIYMRKGQVSKTYRAVFKIEATRLKQSRVMFDNRPERHDSDFEVSDIQMEIEGPSPETTDSSLYAQ